MKYHPLPVSKTYRRFVALAGKVQRLLERGEFQQLPPAQQQQLADKLNLLFQRLSAFFSQGRLRRILASATLVLGLGAGAVQAQEFTGPIRNPFGLNPGEISLITFADLDNDGDQDLMSIQYNYSEYGQDFVYFENIGNAEAPAFGPPQTNPFGLSNSEFLTTPYLVDIDDDGDLDLFVSGYEYESSGEDLIPVIWYFENTGMVNSTLAQEQADRLKVFPTVTEGLLNWQLNLSETAEQLQLQAFTSDGRQLQQWRVDGLPGKQQGQVDVGALPAGLYQLRLSHGNGRLLGQKRFVVR